MICSLTCLLAAVVVQTTFSAAVALPGDSRSTHHRPNTNTPNYLITFGDSYSQTGFNISETHASPGNVLGNPAFPGYTTANGNQSNWIDDLVMVHNRTTTLSYNFASGGATTNASLVPGYLPYPQVMSFVNQVSEFTSNIANGPWSAENTLFGIWMGVNDVGNGWYQSNWTTVVQEVLGDYFDQVDILYKTGARNFVFLTVPPITLTPDVQSSSNAQSIAQENTAIETYNGLIASNVASFVSSNPDVKHWVFNTTTPFLAVINDPTAYGAANSTCFDSTGTECIWYNNYHPGAMIHAKVAEGVAELVGAPWFQC